MNKKKSIVLLILGMIGIILLCLLNRIPIPQQGEYVFDGDSNCILTLGEYTYEFSGEGDYYESIIKNFGKKGEIKKVRELYESELYMITNDENGPYFTILEDGSVEFCLGINYSDSYDFIKK